MYMPLLLSRAGIPLGQQICASCFPSFTVQPFISTSGIKLVGIY